MMGDKWILDEHGEPQRCDDVLTWAHWFETSDPARQIALDCQGKDVVVSTVFIGLDFNPLGTGPPLLYETAVLNGDYVRIAHRYATRDEALAGHREVCRELKI